MEKVRILGIVGSPRKNGNTAKMVERALEAVRVFPWVETDLFEVAGKKIGHCVSCNKCMETGQCVIRDGLYEFCEKWMAADGILWAVPVYHMSVPSQVKALLDRFGNSVLSHYLKQGREVPRFCKAVGVMTNGASRYGGQDLTLSYLAASAILMKGIVVSGDTFSDSYLGAAAWTGQDMNVLSEDNILKDKHGLACAQNVARRVAEMARIVKAGKAALGPDLPGEYSYTWKVEKEQPREKPIATGAETMLIQQPQRMWASPLYADFPRNEYDGRLGRARTYMAEQKIDILVLWDAVNIRYFTGFQSLHWSAMSIQPAVVLLPLEKDPVIVVPDFFSQVAEGYTYLKDIRLLPKPHLTKNIRHLPVDIAETGKSLGCGRARIGIEAGWQGGMAIPRPVNDIDTFRSTLEGAAFVDAADLIWKCRMIKSASEIEALRRACQAVVRAYGELVAQFELGMSERDVGRLIRHAILDFAEDCMPPIATASSRRVVMPDTPSFYDEVTLTLGDRIVFEPLPTYKGYHGSCCRCFQIGPLPDAALRKAEAVDRAQAAAIAAIKPGLQTRVILDVIAESLRSDGIEPTIEMAGHGAGLNPHEPPMISEEEEAVFEEGMVMAVEVWVVDWKGGFSSPTGVVPEVFGNEDYVVVTKEGCDQLADFRKDIRTFPYEGPSI